MAAVNERPVRKQSETSFSMRISRQELNLIDDAAVATGKSRTDFVLDCARRHAIDVLLDQRLLLLDESEHDAFMRALDHPSRPTARLKTLMKSPPPWDR